MTQRIRSMTLFWRVCASNVAVLALIFLALVFAPVTVSVPVRATELLVLGGGLIVMLAVIAVLGSGS